MRAETPTEVPSICPDSISRGWLLVYLLAVSLPLYCFGWLAEADWTPGGCQWNGSLLKLIHQCDSPSLDKLMIFTAQNGDVRMVVLFTLVCAVLLLVKQYRWEERFLAHCVVGAVVIVYSVKAVLYRVNAPATKWFPPQVDIGSPSAHSMGTLTFALGLVVLAWRTRWRWPVVGFGFVYTFSVAWSRVYLGVHEASDVLSAWALALAWVSLMRLVHDSSWKALSPGKKATISAVGILANILAILAGSVSCGAKSLRPGSL